MRKVIARKIDSIEPVEGYLHRFTTDKNGVPCAIVEEMDGSVFLSYGLKQFKFIDPVPIPIDTIDTII